MKIVILNNVYQKINGKTHGERITDLISIYDSFVSLLIYLITFTGMHEANFYCSKVVAVLRK